MALPDPVYVNTPITPEWGNDVADTAADHEGRLDTIEAAGWATTTRLADSAVTRAKISPGLALSVIGRSANSAGVTADIQAATDGHALRRSGNTLGFGPLAADGIADGAVTNPKLAAGIDAGKITTGTLPIARIADGAVSNPKLADATGSALTTGGARIEYRRLGNLITVYTADWWGSGSAASLPTGYRPHRTVGTGSTVYVAGGSPAYQAGLVTIATNGTITFTQPTAGLVSFSITFQAA